VDDIRKTIEGAKMPSNSDRERAATTLRMAIGEDSEQLEEWWNQFLYAGIEPNNDVIDGVKKSIRGISNSLGWGNWRRAEVPPEQVPRLMVESLGDSLLRAKSIREVLANFHYNGWSDEERNDLSRLLRTSPDQQSLVASICSTVYRPSTRFATKFCHLTNMPLSYSQGSGSDDRPRFEKTGSATPLPPLLDFQKTVYEGIIDSISMENGRRLVVMPTGAGKTRTTVQSIIDAIAVRKIPSNGIVWLADREELCEQAVETFKQVAEKRCPVPLYIWRYWRGNLIDVMDTEDGSQVPGIVVTSVQQFRQRIESGEEAALSLIGSANVFVVDEAHRNLDWLEGLDMQLHMDKSTASLIGLTATPFRRIDSESTRLSKIFSWNALSPIEGGAEDPDQIVSGLMERGILAKRVDLNPEELGVRVRVGDAHQHLTECIDIVRELIVQGCKSILVFTPSVEIAQWGASILSLGGDEVTAEYLCSSTPIMSRREIVGSFREGGVQVLLNCEILTTGFDAPKTDAVVISRPSMSADDPLFLQMAGRGLRGPKFGGTGSCVIVHHKW